MFVPEYKQICLVRVHAWSNNKNKKTDFCSQSKTTKLEIESLITSFRFSQERNVVEAAARGAIESTAVIASIAVNLIAFIALMAFLDSGLHYLGDKVGYPELSFQVRFKEKESCVWSSEVNTSHPVKASRKHCVNGNLSIWKASFGNKSCQ